MNQPLTLQSTMVATPHSGEPRLWQGSYTQSQHEFAEVYHQQGSQLSKGNANTGSSQKKQSCPLLTSLLTSSDSSKETHDNNSTGAHLSQDGYRRNQKRSLAVSNCGRTTDLNPSHSAPMQPSLHQQQLSTDMFLTANKAHPPTDEQIKMFIANSVAYFRTVQKRSIHGDTITEVRDATLPSTICDRRVQKQTANFAVVEKVTTSVRRGLNEDGSNGNKAKTESTFSSKLVTVTASEKLSKGTVVSAEENSKHTLENDPLTKSESVFGDLPIEWPLDVTVPAHCDGKALCLDDLCEDPPIVRSNEECDHSKGNVRHLQKDMPTVPYPFAELKELIATLENRETVAEMDSVSKVILKHYLNGDKDNIHLFTSMEYPQIMMEVAAICTKNEDQGPVVLTAVSGITPEQLTEKHSSLIAGSLNMDKTLKDSRQEPDDSWALRPKEEKGDGGLTAVEDSKKTMTQNGFGGKARTGNPDANPKKVKNTEDQQSWSNTKLSSLFDKNKSVLAKQSKVVCDYTGEETGSVYSNMAPPEYKNAKDAPRREGIRKKEAPMPPLKDCQYEDISDDEYSAQLDIKRLHAVHEGSQFQTCFESPQYENISEDEDSQNWNLATEKPSLSQALQCSNKQQFLFQVCIAETGEHISDGQMIPGGQLSLGTDDKLEDHTDDDDDDYTIIPIIVSGLKYEPEDEDRDAPGEVRMQDSEVQDSTNPTSSNLGASKPAAASAFSHLEVFETIQNFKQAKMLLFFGPPVPEVVSNGTRPGDSMHCEGEPHTPENKRKPDSDPDDSGETEDSSDYSSASETNRLTVSKKFMTTMSAALPSKQDSSVCEKESNKEVPQVQKFRPKTFKQRSSKREKKAVLIIDSDTEDELFQNSEVADCQPRGCSPQNVDRCSGTIKETILRKPLPADLPGPECQYKVHESEIIDLRDSADSGLSEEKALQHNAREPVISKKKSVIILDLDSEEDGEQKYKKPKRKKLFRPGHAHSNPLKRCSPENEKLKNAMQSTAGPSVPRQRSKVRDKSRKSMTEDACPDPSRSISKSTRLIDGRAGLEDRQNKTNKQSSNKRKKIRRIMSTESEDSDDGGLAAQNQRCRTAAIKPQTSRLSSEKCLQPHKEADPALVPNPIIPRFIVESAQKSELLKLSGTSTTRKEGKDKAKVLKTSKVIDKNAKADLYKNEKGGFQSKEQPAKKRYCRATNEGQAGITKHPLPSQEVSSTSEARKIYSRSSSHPGAVSSSAPVKCPSRLQPPASKLQRSFSSNSPSMGSSSSATKQSAKMQVRQEWKDNYYPINGHRRTSIGMEEDFRNTNCGAQREARPGPRPGEKVSRPRHSSHECQAPLMKKTISDFKQLTKAKTREDQKRQGYSVGEGYKWSEKPSGHGGHSNKSLSAPAQRR